MGMSPQRNQTEFKQLFETKRKTAVRDSECIFSYKRRASLALEYSDEHA
jgi:hypothetical protein